MADVTELVYVSWGGTGRAATLREALLKAYENKQALLYLAILDHSTFSDVDDSTMALAIDELSWLIDAQLELTRDQANAEDVPVRVLVRSGDVVEQVCDVVAAIDAAEVLVGAPVPVSGHDSITDLIDAVSSKVSVPVSLVDIVPDV